MSRRRRALAFLLLAVLAALGAALIAERYGARAAQEYGRLRPVVVVPSQLAPGRSLGPGEVARLAVRRVPERFVPPGALASPAEALGLVARAPIPAGSYLLAAQLGEQRPRKPAAPRPGRGRYPVEIAVSGAGALLAARSGSPRIGVDVVVSAEPLGGGKGRTFVAAAAVPLLALRPGPEGAGGPAAATLGLTRAQALRLISAEAEARRVTLLPRR